MGLKKLYLQSQLHKVKQLLVTLLKNRQIYLILYSQHRLLVDINKPIILGKTRARIIASEKAQTEDMSPAAPITINTRNNIL